MIRAGLDANVIVSAVVSPAGVPARILQAWEEERFDLLLSPAVLDEVGRVLRYPKVRRAHGWTEARVRALLDALGRGGVQTTGGLGLAVVREDPSDDRYLECALEGGADYLVSGDGHLLRLREYRGIRVVTPREFLEVLRGKEGA